MSTVLKVFVALYAEEFYALQQLTTRKAGVCRLKGKVISVHTTKAHKGVVEAQLHLF
jgi:hypothetical protein